MRFYFLFFLLLLFSCNEKRFASNELGFKIEVPNGYKILNSDVDESENNLLNDINNKGLDVKQLNNLICIQKDEFNLLTSTTRAYDNYNLEEWEIDIVLSKKMAFEMYRENGIKMDTTKTIDEKIGGYDFKKYTFVIYDDNNEKIANQLIYNGFVRGLNFNFSINYNNESEKEKMLYVLNNSNLNKI